MDTNIVILFCLQSNKFRKRAKMGLDNFLTAFSKFISRNHLVTVHIVQRIYKPAQELMVL